MKATAALRRLVAQEDLNFLLTNRVPRIALTRLVGRVARIDSPAFAALAIGIWKLFTDLDLAESPPRRYRSLRECFTRELRPGARPVDPDPAVVASPCDGIVGACGAVDGRQVVQAKGLPYTLPELFGPTQDTAPFVDGVYVTLRLTSAMYHRFHAPHDLKLEHVTHIAGDTWNVNPIALTRVERLFCRNERAVLRARLVADGTPLAIVPVAAIAVASLRLHAVRPLLHVDHPGPHEFECDAAYAKGQEMGWFEQGSTIIVFAPRGLSLAAGVETGARIRMGRPLLARTGGQRAVTVGADDRRP
jgi:phosphatidylserine decarboxylase